MALPHLTHPAFWYPHVPPPLWKAVKPITLEEYLESINWTIYLPAWLPDGLRPVAVWKKGNIAVIAYDYGHVENYEEAALTIDLAVYSLSKCSTPEDVESSFWRMVEDDRKHGRNITVIVTDDMMFKVDFNVYMDPEVEQIYNEKFGSRGYVAFGYIIVNDTYFLDYAILMAPQIATPQEFIKIIESLQPAN